MTRPITAMCDNCHKITDVLFKEKRHPNDIRETYFKCEHCYHHYTAFVTDSKVRKMQLKKPSLTWGKRLELQEDINSRMSKLKYNLINFGRADL
ncbi:hypothetical protein [Oceanobacillus sp. FSL W7-1309]|uniref:hypothetical protein n=1 Tax=Oceanobacillus sp. FSL W7-1309 TaxID=2954539 RepID=UPI0030FBA6E7